MVTQVAEPPRASPRSSWVKMPWIDSPTRRMPDMGESDLHSVAFPRLDEVYLTALERCVGALRKTYRAGEKLFEAGRQYPKFFVVKSGEVEIVDDSGSSRKTVTLH